MKSVSNSVLNLALAALLWGVYPLIQRSTGQGGPAGAFVLGLASAAALLLALLVAVLWQGTSLRMSTPDLGRLIVAGAMQGLGLLAFNVVVNDQRIPASVSIPIVDAAMPIVSVVCAVIFFAEPFTMRVLVGLALILAGIAVLRPQ